MLLGAMETDQMVAVGVIVISTLLNAAYFLPIVYAAFFRTEEEAPAHHTDDHHEHGEAPLPIVIALMVTATGTVLMFFFPEIVLNLAQQLVGNGG